MDFEPDKFDEQEQEQGKGYNSNLYDEIEASGI